MKQGILNVAAATPEIRVADCAYNAGQIIELMKQAAEQGVQVLVLPELCLTGSTCGDLFWQETLLEGAAAGLNRILEETAGLDVLAAVGLPVAEDGQLYNCAVLIKGGKVLARAAKTKLSAGEGRWFTAGKSAEMFDGLIPGVTLGVSFGDECPKAGAQVMLHLSALPALAGSGVRRREWAKTVSAWGQCACICADAGEGESTTDLVFGGHDLIAAKGVVLAEQRFETGLLTAEITLDELTGQCTGELPAQHRELKVKASPFIPCEEVREERFEEILTIAALGLKKRLKHTHCAKAVIGLSGGLDSTLAILTAVRAYDLLGWDRKGILAVTMPCFGTTARTRSNAELLAEGLGTDFMTVDIGAAVKQHFADIGHDMDDHSVTFENAQARERTQVLMDVANKLGGMVIGTGDLSELALGWCTYNGDQMSMYSVNGGIPKTLMRHLVAHIADRSEEKLACVLRDILDTPVSPELLPPKDGEIAQRTEDLVGPYELHDFYLYYAVGKALPPKKVYELARQALGGIYDNETLLKWLNNFYRRFFNQQFKRSCMPDGPKVGSLSLSPRGGFEMPSDAISALWLAELEGLG